MVFHPIEHARSLTRLRHRYPTDETLAASATVRCFGSL